MIDYSVFYKTRFPNVADWSAKIRADVFVSAFNMSERVNSVFAAAPAARKIWLVHQEYDIPTPRLPTSGEIVISNLAPESQVILDFLDATRIEFATQRVCVDITGFMRPHLMFLLRVLAERGIERVDLVYSEPGQYKAREETTFTTGTITDVRQVEGFAGTHLAASTAADLLIIAAGYEHDLIAHVAESRRTARPVQIFAFPSLQADFYQEGMLRASRAAEAVGVAEKYFAPAHDPFVTASVVQEIIRIERQKRTVDNIYLSPLATKAQAAGFAFFYIHECIGKPVSIVYPFAEKHHPETATGVAGVWHYEFELGTSVGLAGGAP